MVFDDRKRGLEEEYFARQNKEAIEKLREKLRASAAANAGPSSMRCPRCEGNLNETKLDDISIDVCDKCGGVWLDVGELAQITQKASGGGWLKKLLGQSGG